MTPKEKANELIDKFYQAQIEVLSKIGLTEFEGIENQIAIKSSLIAVDEAEKSEYNVLIKFGFVTKNYKSDYWQEVKNELNLL
jgi:hypothetical protein